MTASRGKSRTWLWVLLGGIAGFLLCGVVVFMTIPSLMFVTAESTLGFDGTVASLQERITRQGWVVSNVIDMNKSMAKHGVDFQPRVSLVKLCKPEYAKSVLSTDRYVSCMMPCTMSVWEGDHGKVYLTRMNMALMAKMFGGNISKVMGCGVVRDEEKILEGLLKK